MQSMGHAATSAPTHAAARGCGRTWSNGPLLPFTVVHVGRMGLAAMAALPCGAGQRGSARVWQLGPCARSTGSAGGRAGAHGAARCSPHACSPTLYTVYCVNTLRGPSMSPSCSTAAACSAVVARLGWATACSAGTLLLLHTPPFMLVAAARQPHRTSCIMAAACRKAN